MVTFGILETLLYGTVFDEILKTVSKETSMSVDLLIR